MPTNRWFKKQKNRKSRAIFGVFVLLILATALHSLIRWQWYNIASVLALTSVQLNNGTTTLSTYSNLTSQNTGLSPDTAAYTWTVGGNDLMALNVPFDDGATISDLSGWGSSGTVTNATFLNSGCKVGGGCMSFDGSGDYVTFPDSAAYTFTDQITLSLWAKSNNPAGQAAVAQGSAASTYTALFWLSGGGSSDTAGIYIYTTSNTNYFSACGFTDGTFWDGTTWHHLVGTYNRNLASGQLKMYVDGTLCNSVTVANEDLKDTAGGVHLGRLPFSTSYLNGQLDEVQIYDRALNQAEITQLYNDGNAGLGGPTQIVADETRVGDVWDLDMTAINSSGAIGSTVASANTVTISGNFTAGLNGGTTTLSTYSDLNSQVTGLGDPQAAYTWIADANNLMLANLPFNPGTTQNDYSGNGNDGVNSNGPVYHLPGSGDCKVGGCQEFDGTDDYTLINNDLPIGSTNTFALAAWIKTATTANSLLIGKYNVSDQANLRVNWTGSTNKASIFLADGVHLCIAISTTDVNDDSWHYLVGIRDATQGLLLLYVDGVLEDTVSESSCTNSSVASKFTSIGASDSGANGTIDGGYYTGLLDEIQIFSRALSSTEIATLYSDGLAGNAGPTTITAAETVGGEVWDLDITPFDSDGTALSLVNSANTVTITDPGVTAELNNGTTTLSSYSDLGAQVTNLGDPQAAYTWTVDGGNLMALNYPFDSASTETDYSGNSNTGTAANGPVYYPPGSGNCQVGGCIEFDGTNDRVTAPDSSSLDIANQVTITYWIKSTDSDSGMIVEKGVANGYYSNLAVGGQISLAFYSSSVLKERYSSGVFNDGNWHHWAGVYDGNSITIYKDGVFDIQQAYTGSIDTNTGLLYLGTRNAASNFLNGTLDELQIYPRALSGAEIADIYADGNANLSGPTTIASSDTLVGQIWGLDVTPFESDGTALSIVNSANTVTITDPGVTAGLNSGTTTLSSYSNLDSQISTLSDPAAAYKWTVDAGNLMAVNLPFNPGATQTDYSGNGLTGTPAGSPVFYQQSSGLCKTGGCLDLSADYLNFGDAGVMDFGTSDFTFEGWVKTTTATSTSLYSKRPICGHENFLEVVIDGSGVVLAQIDGDNVGNGYNQATSSTAVNDGNWHHYAAVRKGKTLYIYIDGTLEDAQSGSTTVNLNNTSNFYIGNNPCVGSSQILFTGSLDEYHVWNRALWADEIQAIYNEERGSSQNASDGVAGPTSILSSVTTVGEVWNLSVTPFDADGSALTVANSANSVTITDPGVTLGQNNGVSTLSSYSNLDSQTANLSVPQAAYKWSVDGNNLMALNMPFNSGLSQTDYSGNGNTGTAIGGAIYVAQASGDCKVGDCFEFDGSNDYINVPGINIANSSFSLSAWVKKNSIGVDGVVMGQGDTQTTNQALHFVFLAANTLKLGFYANDLTTTSTFTDTVNWYHIVGTYNADTNLRKIYVNGVEEASGTASADYQGSGNFYVGKQGFGTGNFFNGYIDEAQVYNRALSSDEVMQLYTDGGANHAGPSTITAAETTVGEMWNVNLTPFDSDASALTLLNADTTVTITAPTVTAELNNGATVLNDSSDLTSQVTGLSDPAAAYAWTVDSTPWMLVNIPFNTGSTQTDFSGNGYDGTIVNSPVFNPPSSGECQVGGCLDFNGTSDSIDLPAGNFSALQTGTVSAWFRAQGGGIIIGSLSDSSNNRQFNFGPTTNGITVTAVDESGTTQFICETNATPGPADSWGHFAYATQQGSGTFQFYYNGLPVTHTCSVGSETNFFFGDAILNNGVDSIQIAAKSDNANVRGLQFGGLLDEIQIFDHVLSADEIAQMYADGSANLAGPTTIKAAETTLGQVWDLDMTPFDFGGSALTLVNSANTVTISNDVAPNAPTIISPTDGKTVYTVTPHLSAQYDDSDPGDTGVTEYRVSSSSTSDCVNNVNVVSSGSSSTTTTNSEATSFTTSTLTDLQTYYWCARNNDGLLTSSSGSFTAMGSFSIDTSLAGGAPVVQQQQGQAIDTSLSTPQIGAASPLSQSSIQYTWAYNGSNQLGFRILDANGTTKAQISDPSATLTTEQNLPNNTKVSGRTVVAYNTNGISQKSSVYQTVTTFAPPVSPIFVSRSDDGIHLSINETVNNVDQGQSGIQFELLVPGTALSAAAVTQSDWVQQNTYIFSVPADQDVQVRARARNQDGVMTAWSPYLTIAKGVVVAPKLSISLVLRTSDGQTIPNPTNPSTVISATMTVRNVGGMSAENSFALLTIPKYIVYVGNSLKIDGVKQTDAVDLDAGQGSNNGVSGVWSALAPGESKTLTFNLRFDQQALADADPANPPIIVLQATATTSSSNETAASNIEQLQPDLAGFIPPPPPPQQPVETQPVSPPTQQETNQVNQLLNNLIQQEVTQTGGDNGNPLQRPTLTPQETQTTQSSSDGQSFTVTVTRNTPSTDTTATNELTITGFASSTKDKIQFTGSTSEPNSMVTLILNGSITLVATSDSTGFWQTYVSADQLGIQPGQTDNVTVEAIASKGDLQSDRVSVGSFTLQRVSNEEMQAQFSSVVSSNEVVTAVRQVTREVQKVVSRNEPQIQQTLTVTAPIVVVSSAPLWGYLPYIPTLLYHFITYVIGLLGRKKKKERYQGTVYDSITKEPLGLAIIRVYEKETNRLAATQVSDKQGHYDFLLKPGAYRLEVRKPQYVFPSKIVNGMLDGAYSKVYNPEQGVAIQTEMITVPDVPLDPQNAQQTWQASNIFKKIWISIQKVGHFLAVPILFVGALASLVVVASVPDNPINWILSVVYVVMFLLQLKLRQKVVKAWGVVYDVATNAPLPLTTLQLIDPEFGKIVKTRLSDYQGRFRFAPEPGSYILKAEKQGFQPVEIVEAQNLAPKRHPITGPVAIQKSGQTISGDVPMRQM